MLVLDGLLASLPILCHAWIMVDETTFWAWLIGGLLFAICVYWLYADGDFSSNSTRPDDAYLYSSFWNNGTLQQVFDQGYTLHDYDPTVEPTENYDRYITDSSQPLTPQELPPT